MQDLDKCLGMDDALFLKYLNEKKAKVYHHLYKEIYVYFFLSIPIPGFIPSDRFAWNGPLRLSLISSVLLLLGKTKSFVFLSLIRRTH